MPGHHVISSRRRLTIGQISFHENRFRPVYFSRRYRGRVCILNLGNDTAKVLVSPANFFISPRTRGEKAEGSRRIADGSCGF